MRLALFYTQSIAATFCKQSHRNRPSIIISVSTQLASSTFLVTFWKRISCPQSPFFVNLSMLLCKPSRFRIRQQHLLCPMSLACPTKLSHSFKCPQVETAQWKLHVLIVPSFTRRMQAGFHYNLISTGGGVRRIQCWQVLDTMEQRLPCKRSITSPETFRWRQKFASYIISRLFTYFNTDVQNHLKLK